MAAQIKPEKMGLLEKRSIYMHRIKREPHYQPIPLRCREFHSSISFVKNEHEYICSNHNKDPTDYMLRKVTRTKI